MKLIYLAVTFIICILADAKKTSQDEYKQIKLSCANKFGISKELMDLFRDNASNVPENSNTQGYANCIVTKTGIYDPKSGTINAKQIKELFGEKILCYYETCKIDQGNLTPQAWIFYLSKCTLSSKNKKHKCN